MVSRLEAYEALELIRRILSEYGVESGPIIDKIKDLLRMRKAEEAWESLLDAALQVMAEWSALNPEWGGVARKL